MSDLVQAFCDRKAATLAALIEYWFAHLKREIGKVEGRRKKLISPEEWEGAIY